MNFIVYLISINLIAFIVMWIDKRRSIRNKWRVKEITLLLIALMGGCFGMYLGMQLLRHKTKKLKFKLVPILCIIWGYFIYVLFTKIV